MLKKLAGLAIPAAACLLTTACQKDAFQLAWTAMPLTTRAELSAVWQPNDTCIWAVGGNSWFSGWQVYSTDAGKTWRADSINTNQLYDLQFDRLGYGYAVGINGQLLVKPPGNTSWQHVELPDPRWLRAVFFYDPAHGLAAGGQGFRNGRMTRFGTGYRPLGVDTFQQEFSGLWFTDSLTAVAVAYGLVLRTTTGGRQWDTLPLSGDFFRSVCFPTASTGYIVGNTGSILKSTDGGKSWSYLRDAAKYTVADYPFVSVFFDTPDKGYIVGENGLCWRTRDGGNHWETADNLPDVDFNDVFYRNGKGWIAGKNGTLIRFSD